MKIDKFYLNLRVNAEENLLFKENFKGFKTSSAYRFQSIETNVEKMKNFQKKEKFQKLILDMIREINKKLDLLNKGLRIEIDEELKIPVFKIIDLETKEILRQIPWEEVLKLRKFLKNLSEEELKNKEFLKGLFLKKEV